MNKKDDGKDVSHGVNGQLISLQGYDCINNTAECIPSDIPKAFVASVFLQLLYLALVGRQNKAWLQQKKGGGGGGGVLNLFTATMIIEPAALNKLIKLFEGDKSLQTLDFPPKPRCKTRAMYIYLLYRK